ncbi:diaminopimelate epimerase [hydrocarbon metagenome]|uniref:diaminopimelate epimerase n=1 Tax=hydrocarbon metagenome TaxID=938273 RepID=A0A0W8E6E4_9ZZZZ
MEVIKMHGLGNDFIVAEASSFQDAIKFQPYAVKLCDRHFGIGADGLILTGKDEDQDVFMRIFNPDGSEPEMCGNGIRCVALYARRYGLVDRDSFSIKTLAGPRFPEIYKEAGQEWIRVDMGEPELDRQKIPAAGQGSNIAMTLTAAGREFLCTAVSMGNPHAIIYVDDINSVPLTEWGPQIETHKMFPEKTNVEFVKVINEEELEAVVWERGAGITLACGTGACAILVASVLNGQSHRRAIIRLPGGELVIEWDQEDNHVYMSGPAVEVFRGTIEIE